MNKSVLFSLSLPPSLSFPLPLPPFSLFFPKGKGEGEGRKRERREKRGRGRENEGEKREEGEGRRPSREAEMCEKMKRVKNQKTDVPKIMCTLRAVVLDGDGNDTTTTSCIRAAGVESAAEKASLPSSALPPPPQPLARKCLKNFLGPTNSLLCALAHHCYRYLALSSVALSCHSSSGSSERG